MARYENVDGTFGDYQEVKSEYVLPGTEFSWSSDETVEWQAAEVKWTVAEADKVEKVDILKQLYYLDVNWQLDDNNVETYTATYGVFNITVNGKDNGERSDYWKKHRYGSTFKVDNVKTNTGYEYSDIYDRYNRNLDVSKQNVLTDTTSIVIHVKSVKTEAELTSGQDFNKKIKTLAGGDLNNIQVFSKSENKPNMSSMTSDNIISTESSDYPIYA